MMIPYFPSSSFRCWTLTPTSEGLRLCFANKRMCKGTSSGLTDKAYRAGRRRKWFCRGMIHSCSGLTSKHVAQLSLTCTELRTGSYRWFNTFFKPNGPELTTYISPTICLTTARHISFTTESFNPLCTPRAEGFYQWKWLQWKHKH